MAEEYELKQVKVRLKLAEAEPLYSTEQITTPDKAAEVMAQVLSQMDREYCCVVNLDGANHPINFNVVSIGDVNQAHVPIQNVFKSAILSNAASIMMFHNHPSGSVKASREDIDVTKRLIEAGKIMNIPVLDHIIVGGGTTERFSFKEENPEMFNVSENMAYTVHERERVPIEGDSFSIYQLKDDDALRYIRFEGLERLQAEGNKVEQKNYDLVYEAPLKEGTTLDDLYYQFNMQHPADFRGHSMSVSDIVVLHQGDEDKAFYVDRFGFTEVPDFLLEKTAGLDMDEAAYKLGDRYISIQRTDEGFDYSIYNEEYHLLDGGVLDVPDISMGEVLQQITDELKQPVYDAKRDTYTHTELQGSIRQKDEAVVVDYDDLMEKVDAVGQEEIQAVKSAQEIIADFRAKTEEMFDSKPLHGMSPAVIEETVRDKVLQIVEELELDVTIEYVIVSGSRCRGLETADSDLDVLVSYSGTEREDDFFNTLHEEGLLFGKVELDINPINTEQTGTLANYLPTVEKHLTEKSIDRSFKEPALELMGKYGYELVAEQGKEHDFTLIRHMGEEESFGFDGWQMINDYFREADDLVEKHSLSELRSRLEVDFSIIPLGIADEQLRAAIRLKEEQELAIVSQKQVVTFTVAESSEFHNFGELHEGIPTLQDAIKIYEKLRDESKMNGIPAIGINLHTKGTSEIEDMQCDIFFGDHIDLEGLIYQPEMTQNAEVVEALHQLAENYPDADILGRFPDEPVQEQTLGHDVQKSEELTSGALAVEIDQFMRDYDLYSYRDAVDDREANIAQLKADIESNSTGYIKDNLLEIVNEEEGEQDDIEKAKELLAKLAEYKPLAKVEEREEQNYNMIDNVLNNLPQDPEEKKEPAPQKEMRTAEVKNVRKRVSMKKLLAEKKVEVAEREKKPPEVGAPTKRPSMGVDD